ncbi:hypothetical protein IMCC20628_04839 (plasmid) [Hoeflea sp. IMCC20628]|nr:hypothetical protein IMCC20628_04839 [Hoeflea sp. IMCC20628]
MSPDLFTLTSILRREIQENGFGKRYAIWTSTGDHSIFISSCFQQVAVK